MSKNEYFKSIENFCESLFSVKTILFRNIQHKIEKLDN